MISNLFFPRQFESGDLETRTRVRTICGLRTLYVYAVCMERISILISVYLVTVTSTMTVSSVYGYLGKPMKAL